MMAAPETIEVTLDRGRGERIYIDWCLACQTAAERCPCDRVHVDEHVDGDVDEVAELIAESRARLAPHLDHVEATQ